MFTLKHMIYALSTPHVSRVSAMLYHLIECVDGEKGLYSKGEVELFRFKLLSYRQGEHIKLWCLIHIK